MDGTRVWRVIRTFEARALIAALLVAGGLWALLSLGGEVSEGETDAFDRKIMLALRTAGHPHEAVGPAWLGEALRDVTALGGTTFAVLATALAATGLAFHGLRRRAVLLICVVAGAQACDELLKALYRRDRPDFALAGAYTYAQSFPSGHSTASAALWLTLAMIASSFEAQLGRKLFWFAAALLVIAGVGASRVYLGVHWPTDVLAGWMLGACCALLGWLAWRRLRGGEPAGPPLT
ncbi:MAG TPA: phosphatase PAP2 family protein [Caulobacteraceae bacterium]|nr:phosphatase PAP2 family protein [Caulobacteraceae bacterium]